MESEKDLIYFVDILVLANFRREFFKGTSVSQKPRSHSLEVNTG